MNLREATSYLLRTPDVGMWVELADNYMQAYNRMPEKFVLPADHALLRPVIEAFAKDVQAFADYIRALRDASDGLAYDELHKLYRTISTRALQRPRRARIRKAVDLLRPLLEIELGRTLDYNAQMRISTFVEQAWRATRLGAMSDERSAMNAKRLTTEERELLLDSFWENLDKELDAGRVPLGEWDLNDLITELRKT